MAKQSSIKGTEQEQIDDVNAAGEELFRARRARSRAGKRCKEAEAILITRMQDAKLKSYTDTNHAPPLIFQLDTSSVKASVNVADGADADDDGKDDGTKAEDK